MPVHIRLRRDTAAGWILANPVLLLGEAGIETDTRKWKVGDGSTAWNALAYFSAEIALEWGAIVGDITDQTDLVTYISGRVAGLFDDRGNYDSSGNAFPAAGGSGTAGAILKGDIWTVSVGGTLGGHAVSPGDLLRALVDSPGSTDANWAITENNLGYVAETSANKDTDGTLAANSDTKFSSQKAVKAYVDTAIAGIGGGSALIQSTVTKTTASLAVNAVETGVIALGKVAIILKLTADRACRVRLYATSALRTADASRALGIAVSAGSNEPLLEAAPIPGFLALDLFDVPTVYNGDATPVSNIYYAIQNLSASTHTVQVDFKILALEA